MQLDHINISVPRGMLETIRDFYCQALGLTVGERPAFRRRGYWLYGHDGACVHLIESDRHRRHEIPGHLDHVAFRASDPVATIERLRTAGIAFDQKEIPELGLTQLFLHDPAGVRLELNFPHPDR
jgi:catechol 2,3-dioxygenase-like lactoylglutathione lyase family enzyme